MAKVKVDNWTQPDGSIHLDTASLQKNSPKVDASLKVEDLSVALVDALIATATTLATRVSASPLWSPADALAQLRRAQSVGADFVRTGHEPADPGLLRNLEVGAERSLDEQAFLTERKLRRDLARAGKALRSQPNAAQRPHEVRFDDSPAPERR